ncbi:MAG: hypothetical protein M0040_07645 [Actinomycetota bacterium]|nr:hypothetical protein [Actinomycetota bacterium]
MRRKTFDWLLTAGGAMLTIVLIVAGIFLTLSANFANSNVHSQLAKQAIVVPAKGSPALASPKIGPYLDRYAGQEVLTGPAAKAYADHFIAVHLSEMPYGGVYSKVSAAAQADPTNAKLKAVETTVFQGTTLRGLLLEAYAFSVFGEIASWASIAVWVLAGIMLILTILGIVHFRRVSADAELLAPKTK